jgi:putative ABC transport system permease protein
MNDFRYALRLLRRKPGPALVAILTMALGIGATTVLFSVTWGVLMKPLPWPEPERLIRLKETRQGSTRQLPRIMTNGTFLSWAHQPATIEGLAAYAPRTMTLTGEGSPRRVDVVATTASVFGLMRAVPLRGALFTAADESTRLVVLSERLWRQQFGASEDILGRTVRLDGESYTISGVMGDGFQFPERDTQAWLPFRVRPVATPGQQGTSVQLFSAIARLRPGATPRQAAEEATARGRSGPDPGLAAVAIFGTRGSVDVTAEPVLDALTSDVRDALVVLLAAVGLLLAAATANIAGVQLARAATRRREIAVRAALGAGGARLARQMLVESVTVGAIGGAAGLGLAVLLTRALPTILPADFPRVSDIAVDLRITAFASLISLLAGVAFGLLPALQAGRLNLVEGLVDDASAAGQGFGRSKTARARAAIMAVQVAVACVLLVGASLLIQTFVAMLHVDRGYDPSNVLTARLATPDGLFSNARRSQLVTETLARLRALPGVTFAGITTVIPLGRADALMAFSLPPAPGAAEGTRVQTSFRVVSPGYFEGMGIDVLEGRAFDERDTMTSMPMLIVNRTFAKRYLGEHPVGRRLPAAIYDGKPDWEVAGVVEDVMIRAAVTDAPQPEIYVTYKQVPDGVTSDPTFAIRTQGSPQPLLGTFRQIVASQDPSATVESVMTMEERIMGSLARPRLYAIVLAGFAGFALLIAAVGLFGVLSYGVTQRSKELGVRAALGARPRDIVGLVVREGLLITVFGIVAGLAASFVLTRWMATFLYGVQTRDAMTFVLVPMILLLVAAAACFVPARRAARLDPLKVLRS